MLSIATASVTMIELLILPLLAGCGVALAAGPLGSFAVWRRMAYFGDTLAHSALIGVAIGLFFSINITVAIIVSSLFIAAALVLLEQKNTLSTDTILGILSHSALAVGLICVSAFSSARINLFGYLFGDFLIVSTADVIAIFTVAFIVIGLLMFFWRGLIMISTDEDLARVEGNNVEGLRMLLMLLMAAVIALAMKVVGVLLITALLIIPAATSRKLSSSPEAMVIIAPLIGMLSVLSGLLASFFWDVPAGPAVVVVSAIFFLTVNICYKKRS